MDEAPKKRRKRSSPLTPRSRVSPRKKRLTPDDPQWGTPRHQRLIAQAAKGGRAAAANGSRRGVPDGHTRESITTLRENLAEEVKRITNTMTKELGIEDQYATEALEYAVSVIKESAAPGADGKPLHITRDRLAAARLVLDFTKKKPATESTVTLNKAEDFLKALVAEEEKGGSAAS